MRAGRTQRAECYLYIENSLWHARCWKDYISKIGHRAQGVSPTNAAISVAGHWFWYRLVTLELQICMLWIKGNSEKIAGQNPKAVSADSSGISDQDQACIVSDACHVWSPRHHSGRACYAINLDRGLAGGGALCSHCTPDAAPTPSCHNCPIFLCKWRIPCSALSVSQNQRTTSREHVESEAERWELGSLFREKSEKSFIQTLGNL